MKEITQETFIALIDLLVAAATQEEFITHQPDTPDHVLTGVQLATRMARQALLDQIEELGQACAQFGERAAEYDQVFFSALQVGDEGCAVIGKSRTPNEGEEVTEVDVFEIRWMGVQSLHDAAQNIIVAAQAEGGRVETVFDRTGSELIQ